MVNGSGMKFFFYDLETFGRYPFRLRQAEFAYCVTDSEFNLIDGQSGALYCAMPPDLLPDPGSVMVTGITPREAEEKGFRENEYVKRIIASFPDSNVCFTGYNNVKFDDECMRALFFRNFEDPYLMSSYFRSYSRLDILPLVRACHALFPETFRAAVKDDGTPSFRLTELTDLNNLNHEHAHEALSDVMATIAVAGLIRKRQSAFWDLFFRMRIKQEFSAEADRLIALRRPAFAVSTSFPGQSSYSALVLPLMKVNVSGAEKVACLNLSSDPGRLLNHPDPRSFSMHREFDEASGRCSGTSLQDFNIVLFNENRCECLFDLSLLSPGRAAELRLDMDEAERNAAVYLKEIAKAKLAVRVLSEKDAADNAQDGRNRSPEECLYDGFISREDKGLEKYFHSLERKDPRAMLDVVFGDERLNRMVKHYFARNLEEHLTEEERARWHEYCRRHIRAESGAYLARIAELEKEHADDSGKLALLRELRTLAECQ